MSLYQKRRIRYIAILAGIGFLFLFPGLANAISNEQLVGGYHYEPCNTMYGRHGSIDSDGSDIVAAFVTQRGYAGPYNVVLARSTDNGANWQGHTHISTSDMDQWYPDIVMLDIPEHGKVVFVVWQETNNPLNSISSIRTKAVYFDNFNHNWYGSHTIHDGYDGLSNYPRIAGTVTDCAETGGISFDLVRIHFVWEEYTTRAGGYPHWEIWGSEYYWENYGTESSHFGEIDYMACEDWVDLRHPSIDAGVAIDGDNGIGNIEHVVLTFDCKWRDRGTVDVRYKYFGINGLPNTNAQVFQGKGTLVLPEQNIYSYFPDITIWGKEIEEEWDWETVIVGQKNNTLSSNFIAGRASIDLGNSWGSILNIGTMGNTLPELRGVAIDSGLPADGEDPYEWERFEGGITVIWDVDDIYIGPCTEIWSRQLRLSGNTLIVIDLNYDNAPEVDTSGLYGGDLTYVAISYTTIIDGSVVGYSHNLYNGIVFQAADPLWAGDVIYYTNP